MSQYTPATFKPILEHLITDPKTFTRTETTLAFHHLAQDDFSGATPVQVGAFLMALKYSNKAHETEVIASAAEVMRGYAAKMTLAEDSLVVDIVGTGGDGWNTFNVSTTAAIVAAGAGARVCKHGSSASTSSSGSSDLLSALNCPLPGPSSEPLPSMPFTFLPASLYQPSISRLSLVRKSLPFRTIFNVLGPLLNPTSPQGMVLGVYTKELGPVFANALKESGTVKRALIVCGQEGLDEISIAGGTWVWSLEDGKVTEMTLHPMHFGLEAKPLDSVLGSTPEVNAKVLRELLQTPDRKPLEDGDVPEGFSLEAVRDFVLLNAAALLVVAGVASDWKDGVRRARESIDGGDAWRAFDTFRVWAQSRDGSQS